RRIWHREVADHGKEAERRSVQALQLGQDRRDDELGPGLLVPDRRGQGDVELKGLDQQRARRDGGTVREEAGLFTGDQRKLLEDLGQAEIAVEHGVSVKLPRSL